MSDKELALEVFAEFLTVLEGGIHAAKERIKTSKLAAWDPSKIKWENTDGPKGEYQRSEDRNNPHFKTLVKDLVEHDCRLSRSGYFYWLFLSGSTVGRKQQSK